MARRVVLLGPPASGKGTQGELLARAIGAPHLSTGHLLRRSIDRGDPFGVRPLVVAGAKVPDEVVERLLEPKLGPSFVLDGYPRTAAQAAWLDAVLDRRGLPLDAVIEIVVDEDILAARMALRAAAERRSDDRPDVFLRRLADHRVDIADLRGHYGARITQVDGEGSPEEVFARIAAALGL